MRKRRQNSDLCNMSQSDHCITDLATIFRSSHSFPLTRGLGSALSLLPVECEIGPPEKLTAGRYSKASVSSLFASAHTVSMAYEKNRFAPCDSTKLPADSLIRGFLLFSVSLFFWVNNFLHRCGGPRNFPGRGSLAGIRPTFPL